MEYSLEETKERVKEAHEKRQENTKNISFSEEHDEIVLSGLSFPRIHN